MLDIKFLHVHDFLIFQALEPRIYGFYYTKNTSKNIRKYVGTSWTNSIFTYLTLKNFEIFGTYPHSHIATQPHSHIAT